MTSAESPTQAPDKALSIALAPQRRITNTNVLFLHLWFEYRYPAICVGVRRIVGRMNVLRGFAH